MAGGPSGGRRPRPGGSEELGSWGEKKKKKKKFGGRGRSIYTLQGKATESPHFPNGALFGRSCLPNDYRGFLNGICLPSTVSENPVTHTSPRQRLEPFPIGNFDIEMHKIVGLGAYFGKPVS